jgi:NADPH-dependent glutamate synthase beta subunit-like oxidoreductase
MGWLEGDVVVVGGGNVAMDAARCALRLGAASVTVVYRRSRLEMPANAWEVEEAEEEGIRFRFLTAPARVVGREAVEGLACIEMRLGEPDASGRRRPVPVEGSEKVIPCRQVIPAIGLTPRTAFLEGSGVRLDKGGLILTPKSGSALTHRTGVWAGGDAVTGPASVIGACRQGRDAAMAIASSLGARSAWRFRGIKTGLPQSEFATRPRVLQASRPASERKGDFRLIHRVYEAQACDSEGRRCLRCDLEM